MELHKCDTSSEVFFYEQEFYVLSNFSSFSITWKGLRFPTTEHAYHFEKFTTNLDVQDRIRHAKSAHDALKLSRKFSHYTRKDWDEVKVDIMLEILREKCRQHPYVLKKLMETGSRKLIEDSWRDDFWGWGPNKNGKNILGTLWMRIRKEEEFLRTK